MSFDIFLQPFERGRAGHASDQSVLEVLEPLIAERDGGWARIMTADGEAHVYGIDDAGSGLMINRASGTAVWDVMFDLATAAGFVVLPVGCGSCVVDERFEAELPEEAPRPIVIVRSGADLRRAVERA